MTIGNVWELPLITGKTKEAGRKNEPASALRKTSVLFRRLKILSMDLKVYLVVV